MPQQRHNVKQKQKEQKQKDQPTKKKKDQSPDAAGESGTTTPPEGKPIVESGRVAYDPQTGCKVERQVPTYFFRTTATGASSSAGQGNVTPPPPPSTAVPCGSSNGLFWCPEPKKVEGASEVAAEAAKLFLPLDAVDQETLKQVALMSQLPSVEHPRFMPDTHKGASCCVGFTAKMRPFMSPQLIGGDIGCGVSAVPIPSFLVDKRKDKFLKKFDQVMHSLVPMGNGHSHVHQGETLDDLPFALEQLQPFLDSASTELALFAKQFQTKFPKHDIGAELNTIFGITEGEAEHDHRYTLDFFKARLIHLKCPLDKVLRNLGTLGGGNHFMELDELQEEEEHKEDTQEEKKEEVEEDKRSKYLLVVHSGSRCFGQAVYMYWADIQHHGGGTNSGSATAAPAAGGAGKKHHNDHGGGSAADHQQDDDAEVFGFDPDLMLGFQDSVGYFVDMILAQQFAQANRYAMLSVVCSALDPLVNGGGGAGDNDVLADDDEDEDDLDDDNGDDEEEEGQEDDSDAPNSTSAATMEPTHRRVFDSAAVVNSTHNYIDFTDLTIRKGAIQAHKGQQCIVALNARDGIWLCEGKGNPDWNNSGPHGCGRNASRSSAAAAAATGRNNTGRSKADLKKSQQVAITKYREEMTGVYSSTVSLETYDERPSAYRSPELVKAMVGGGGSESLGGGTLTIQGHYKTILSAKGGSYKD